MEESLTGHWSQKIALHGEIQVVFALGNTDGRQAVSLPAGGSGRPVRRIWCRSCRCRFLVGWISLMNFFSSGLNGDEGLGDYQAVFFTAGRRHLCGQMSRLDKDLCSGQVFDQKKIEADEGGIFFLRRGGRPVCRLRLWLRPPLLQPVR